MNPTLQAAAARSAALTGERAAVPQQRRSAVGAGRTAATGHLALRESAAAPGLLTFEGYASVYEQPYDMWDVFGPYTETVSRGAGAVSLARADLDVPLVLDHVSLRRIARTTTGTLKLTETPQGLHVLADQLDPEDVDVAYVAPKIRAGLIDEMSFAFRIVTGTWSPDFTEYRIEAYDIHRGDVAIVGYGANPATTAALRQAPAALRRRAALAFAPH